VEEIEAVVHEATERELTTTEIGEMIMHRRKRLDKVGRAICFCAHMDFKECRSS